MSGFASGTFPYQEYGLLVDAQKRAFDLNSTVSYRDPGLEHGFFAARENSPKSAAKFPCHAKDPKLSAVR
jgi:hypothetical protein